MLEFITNVDPTRTLTTRNRFVAEFKRRFNLLLANIREAIVELDIFGLDESSNQLVFNASGLNRRQYEFLRTDEQVEAFLEWLDKKNEEYLLSGGTRGIQLSGRPSKARESWMATYLDSAYQQGIRRARQELKKRGIEIQDGQLTGEPIQAAFNSMIHVDRVGLIYSRSYTTLEAITKEMESVVSDVLSMGLAEGKNPMELAKLLEKAIADKGESLEITDRLGRKISSLRRAEILARTEVIRAHHSANIGEYKAAGVLGVTVQVEIITAGDKRVCPTCSRKFGNGLVISIVEAENIIPVHPQCRCVALPYIPEN